jgi:peptidoglycan/xylan/chitin deacetylase (PgdA/CDA1 family)
VVVSFDDGFGSWHRVAYPVLRRHGWLGTMNLALSHLNGIDVRKRWMRTLIRAGWELDSHTLTHADLTALRPDDLRREVAGSRRRLRRIFDVPVHFFCYPSGRYNDRVIAAVRAARYLGATTTIEGLATPDFPYVLKRVRVNGTDTPADVLAHIRVAR